MLILLSPSSRELIQWLRVHLEPSANHKLPNATSRDAIAWRDTQEDRSGFLGPADMNLGA